MSIISIISTPTAPQLRDYLTGKVARSLWLHIQCASPVGGVEQPIDSKLYSFCSILYIASTGSTK